MSVGAARMDGFAAIESHGEIGDGESVALVARDGAIDQDIQGTEAWMLSCISTTAPRYIRSTGFAGGEDEAISQ